MKKRVIIIFSAVLIIALLTISTLAASTTATTTSKSCAKGGTVTLDINVSSTSNILSGAVEIVYDKNVLELVDAGWNVNGALLSTFDKATDKGAFAFSSASSISGKIFSVTFKVLSNAPLGNTEVKCLVQLKDGSNKNITVTNNPGKITVTCNHSFTQKNDQYVASQASCTAAARYYYACSICGTKGSTTYSVGSKLPHTFNKKVTTSAYLVKDIKCMDEAEYYYSCSCGQKGTEKFTADASWSHNFSDSWFISADGHWHQCLDCGAKKDLADHTNNGNGVCGKCNFVISGDEPHQHSFDEGWHKSEDAHWRECACGVKDSLELHNWNDGTVTKPATETEEGEMLFTCIDCAMTTTKKIAVIEPEPHQHSFGEGWNKSEDAHWHECSCGLKDGLELHNWDDGSASADDKIVYTCKDCAQTKTEILAHSHSFSENWSHSEDAHWHECSCGLKNDLELHNWDEGAVSADNTIVYTCKDCGLIKTETLAHSHSFSENWSNNEDAHWRECTCGLKDALALHDWGDGQVTTEPTEDAEGIKTYTCIDCGATKTESIPKSEKQGGCGCGCGCKSTNSAALALFLPILCIPVGSFFRRKFL